MSICREKPDMLPPLDAIGLQPADQNQHAISRGGSGHHKRPSGAGPPPISRQASIGLGITSGSSFGKGAAGFVMGQFGTDAGQKLTSQQRFELSRGQGTPTSTTSGFGSNRPTPMTRTTSGSGSGSGRTRSKKPTRRDENNKMQSPATTTMYGPGGIPLEPVAPLQATKNAWKAESTARRPAAVNPDSPEIVDRKVTSLLNKLTMERFDSISDQIIAWANRSEKEKDGRTLIQVIRLVYEKATDEAAWSEMYARLCRKMMEQTSAKVQDESIRSDDKPIAGGQLFRKHLLNRCHEDFERGWAAKDAAAIAAASNSGADDAVKQAEEKEKKEVALYSDEYYILQKAKRRGLGLVKFIGELFKLQMLTERIMHECVKKLLANVDNPAAEEIESLCKLLTTIGKALDGPKARADMDVYLARMKQMVKNPNVKPRIQFMLMDVIELRERSWIPRNHMPIPSALSQVRQDDNRERQSQENLSMSRGGSRRGDIWQAGLDGWAVAGGGGPMRTPPKAGDLSQFGKVAKNPAAMTFGPSGVFAKDKAKHESGTISRTNSSANMFSPLNANPEAAAEASTPGSTLGRRKPSADFSRGGVPGERRKLQLLPRSKPVAETEYAGAVA